MNFSSSGIFFILGVGSRYLEILDRVAQAPVADNELYDRVLVLCDEDVAVQKDTYLYVAKRRPGGADERVSLVILLVFVR